MTTQTLETPKKIGRETILAVADLMPNPANRKMARDEDIKALGQTIKEVGLLHRIIARHHPDEPGKYRIIAGERRWRALPTNAFKRSAKAKTYKWREQLNL